MLIEALLLGTFVALVTWTMEGGFVLFGKTELSLTRYIMMGLLEFVVYLLGGAVSVLFVGRISPMEALKSGEVITSTRRVTKVLHLVQLALTRKYQEKYAFSISHHPANDAVDVLLICHCPA